MKFYFTSFIVLMFFIASTFTTSFAQTLWEKDTLNNPVMDLGKGAPGCVIFDGNTYHAWWGGKDGATYRVSYYTSADGVIWTEYLGNPVLDVGLAGSWDDEGVYRVYVQFDGELYHMWYTGLSGTRANIGYATSPDGINWTKYVGNPVLNVGSAGSWEEDVLSPCVYFDGANYHMWYEGANWPSSSIGYATSPDGLAWTKHAGNPVLTGKAGNWDYPRVEGPAIYFDGTNYHMWYSGASGSWLWQIGYATSVDGISWTKFGNNPVLDKGAPGEWDDQFAAFGTVVVDTVDHLFKMWYGGERENGSVKIGYATAPVKALILSKNTIDFETVAIDSSKLDNVTVYNAGMDTLRTLSILSTNERFRVLTDSIIIDPMAGTNLEIEFVPLTTSEETGFIILTHNTAGSPDTVSVSGEGIIVDAIDIVQEWIPKAYSLSQNFPNPFNPTTHIEFSIPKTEFVNLSVFNMLGQEVATLVSETLHVGSYNYSWDARELASGVYLYKLQAGDYLQTRKMVLLR